MNKSGELHWVGSEGGPLLLLAEDLLGFWEGVRPPPAFRSVEAQFRWSPAAGPTDYDRACDVDDYLGLIDVGPGQGLVLGDAPLRTTWFGGSIPSEGYLVRWIQAHDDAEVRQIMASSLHMLEWKAGLELAIEGVPLVLFDAGMAGERIGDSGLRFSLLKGRYAVRTGLLSSKHDTQLLLHFFTRVR